MEVKQEPGYESVNIKSERIDEEENFTANISSMKAEEIHIKDELVLDRLPAAEYEKVWVRGHSETKKKRKAPSLSRFQDEFRSGRNNYLSVTGSYGYRETTEVFFHNKDDRVTYLLENEFSSLSYERKRSVIEEGRPCPPLTKLVNDGNSNRKLKLEWYKKCSWLTGSASKNRVYCWPCVLFAENKKNPWNSTGIDHLKNLQKAIEKHSISKDHTCAALKLKLFGKQSTQSFLNVFRADIIKYNESVRENRKILSRLIDMTIYLGGQEQFDFENKNNFKTLAEFLSKYDSNFEEFLKESSKFTELLKTTQHDLTDSINHVLNKKIESEINNSACFSWQVVNISHCRSQLSVIFRYIFEGRVVERFMGFFDVDKDSTASSLFSLLLRNFEKFNLKEKLIGQTYDGAAVMPEELNDLQAKIKAVAPLALVTPYGGDHLNLILQDSVMMIQECKVFFATISAFATFFEASPERSKVPDKIYASRLPRSFQTKWNFKSGAISTILKNRDVLVETLEFMINDKEFSNDKVTVHEAVGFRNFLDDHTTLFLLQTFHLIFEQTEKINSAVQIQNVFKTLRQYQFESQYFNNIYESTVSTLGAPSKKRKTTNTDTDDTSSQYNTLFNDILNVIIKQIETRFQDFSALKFFDLLDISKMALFRNKYPTELLNQLCETFPNVFSKEKLENELRVLYSDPNIIGQTSSREEMLHSIYSDSLQEDIPEIYKLLSIILSLPPSSVESSTLKLIKTVAGNSNLQAGLRAISWIFIEKDLLKSLRKGDNFIDEVIDHFAGTSRGIDLVYKKI